jgi:guanosine-3',5'-bis(diphosphate) 3'-pyrophosphohydrolase
MTETSFKKPKVEEIFKTMKVPPTQEEKDFIKRGYDFAKVAHKSQERKSGEPYFNHVFETGKNLAAFGLDAKTITAGFLHDVLEDTEITEEEMAAEFGEEITELVEGVSKLGRVNYKGQERYIESWRKFALAMAEDARVIVIKLADRLHNISTIEHLRPDKAQRIALETIEIHANLADRLGMWKLRHQLEDMAFPYAYPKEAVEIKQLLKQRAKTRQKDLEHVYKKLRVQLAEHSINVDEASYRIKGDYSLFKKLRRKEMDIDKVYDIVALRVIVPAVEDCYKALGVIHSHWRPLPGRIKDYIATAKPNGYQSLHTTIFTGTGGIAEIQIRTIDMHEHAEYGIASHLTYKGKQGQGISKKDERATLEWLSDIRDLQETTKDRSAFLENLKLDLFKKRIFVFTPKGDVVDLPEESSVIDFAFRIHSNIGMMVESAEINGKHSSIYSKLIDGDLVEVKTNKKGHPTSKWLDYAKTSMARKQIGKYLDENSMYKRPWAFFLLQGEIRNVVQIIFIFAIVWFSNLFDFETSQVFV